MGGLQDPKEIIGTSNENLTEKTYFSIYGGG